MLEHKSGNGSFFSSKYKTTSLLYFEEILGMKNAIVREKQLKNWHKDWKWNLIKESNPTLQDLAADWHSQSDIEEYQQMIAEIARN
jgi:putative endonuclease